MSQMSRGEIQDLIGKFAMENPKYRDALIADPKGVLEKQLNMQLPENVNIKPLVETSDTAFVIVPHVAAEGELSDADLESVAGGFADKNADCDNARGGVNTMTIINL